MIKWKNLSKAIFKIPCYCLENKWHDYEAEFMSSKNNHNVYGCTVLIRVVDNTYLYLFIFMIGVLGLITFLCTFYKICGIFICENDFNLTEWLVHNIN